MSKYGPLVESVIPLVKVTREDNRNQNNTKEGKDQEEEYKKEENNGKTNDDKNKIVLKENEKLRSRGKAWNFILNFVI